MDSPKLTYKITLLNLNGNFKIKIHFHLYFMAHSTSEEIITKIKNCHINKTQESQNNPVQ